MSEQTSASRRTGTSVGAATAGLLVTLALLVGVVAAFLLAPLVLFGVALVAYLVVRTRAGRTPYDEPAAGPGASHHGFGAGAR